LIACFNYGYKYRLMRGELTLILLIKLAQRKAMLIRK